MVADIYKAVEKSGGIEYTRDKVASFQTSRGSKYTFTDEGTVTRFKEKTGGYFEASDVIVFLPPSVEMMANLHKQDMLNLVKILLQSHRT